MNKLEYPSTVTAVQIILLYYQRNYNPNRNYQSNRVSNQLVFTLRGKTGDNEGDRKKKYQRPRRNFDNIKWNYFGEKGHYYGNIECYTQTKLKEDAEAFRKMKQGKYSN